MGLALVLSLAACGGKTDGSGSNSAAGSTSAAKAKDSGKTASSAPAKEGPSAKVASSAPPPAPTESAKPADSATAGSDKSPVDVKDILKDDDGEASGVLSVDLSKVEDDAPALGGTKPIEQPAGGTEKMEWVDIGPVSIIQPPGWEHAAKSPFVIFASTEKPDPHAAVIFTGFDKPEDGLKLVDRMTAEFKFKDTKWHKAKPVKLGEDKSMPALISIGSAKDEHGKELKLFFILLKTGQPLNLLALGGSPVDAPEDALNTAIGIVALAKKHP
ncbi:MAG: hypothetical protein U0271_06455 [Polyangiaceae bacterium]